MLPAVDLDDQFGLVAGEIGDEGADRDLAAEAEFCERAVVASLKSNPSPATDRNPPLSRSAFATPRVK
jgi:hypothetical protein